MAAWLRLLDRHPFLHAAGIVVLGVLVTTGGTTFTPVRIVGGLAGSAVVIMWFRKVIMPAALRSVDGARGDRLG